MENIGISKDNGGVQINPSDFKSSCMILSHDLSADKCNSYHTHMLQNGQIGVQGSLKTTLAAAVHLVLAPIYHKVLTIDNDRNTKLNYVT